MTDRRAAVERWQFRANTEGGQERGNALEIRQLSRASFVRYVLPYLAQGYAESFRAYRARHPEHTHYVVVRQYRGEWRPTPPIAGTLAECRPRGLVAATWATRVGSFRSREAREWARSSDSRSPKW